MVAAGQVIAGKYRIDRALGQGGMGSVWVATNLVLQKQVALKVMGDAFREHPDWVARFFREGVAASKARHPGIVQVFDAGEHEGAPWMAMELLEGESLRERLERRGRLDAAEAVRILREVLDALAAVHAVGIVHRDLKPDNIFLERIGSGDGGAGERAKVLDFGIAKEAEGIGALTATGTIVGTAHYLAPEQAKGSRELDARTDLYAVGVLLFECLSGEMPYQATTVPELIAKMYSEAPRDLGRLAPEVPPELRRVVHACLAHDPAGRPPDARALIAALDAAMGSSRAQTGPVSAPSPAWQQAGFAPTQALSTSPPPAVATPPPTRAAPQKKGSSPWPWILGGLAALALLVVLPIVAVIGFGMWTAATVIENAEGFAEGMASSALDFDLPHGGRAMMLTDVDADGTEDVVGWIMRFDAQGESSSHLAAYDGTTGSRIWISESLGTVDSQSHSKLALAADTLLLANGAGEVHGYAVSDGRPRWHFNVGERPTRFCASDESSAILVTADERRTSITLADGSSRPAPEGPCLPLMSDSPQGWHPARIAEAPWEELDAYEVEAEGMSVDLAYGDGSRTFVAGQRDSGTRIPRAGVVGAWQVDVPGVSPLRAEASAPEAVFLGADEAIVAYAMEGEAPARLTALALADGTRRYDVELSPSNFDPQYVQAGASRVAVGHGGHVDVFDRQSGRLLFHLGR